MEKVNSNLMEDIRRPIRVFFLVLIVFGFFYFCRQKAYEGYLATAQDARQSGNEDVALSSFVWASSLEEKGSGQTVAARRAEIFFSRGDYRGAEEELQAALAARSQDADIYAWLGKIKSAQGKYAEAETYFGKGAALGAELTVERAKNLVRAGKFPEAEKILEEGKTRAAAEEIAYYRGLVRANSGHFSTEDFRSYRQGRYEAQARQVEEYFSPETVSDPALARTWVGRADLFRRLGEAELALADLDIALGHDGRYRDAYLVLGKTLLGRGEMQGAEAAFEKCREMDGDHPQALFYLGKIYRVRGEEMKAAELMEMDESLAG